MGVGMPGAALVPPCELQRTGAMPQFYKPDLGANPDDPFARDENDKLVRRSFWLDMTDRSFVLAMTAGIGADLANEQKRAHLADL